MRGVKHTAPPVAEGHSTSLHEGLGVCSEAAVLVVAGYRERLVPDHLIELVADAHLEVRVFIVCLIRRDFKAAETHEVGARHEQARATDVVDRAYKGKFGRVRPGPAAVAQCRAVSPHD